MDTSPFKCCCPSLLNEFKISKFSLYHDKPADFCRSQWQRGERSWFWLIYRWSLAAFFAGGFLGSVIEDFDKGTWFIYLTEWGFTLCFYTCTFGAVVATIYFLNSSYFESGSCSLKIYWASHFATTVLALVITLVYWSTIYPSLSDGTLKLYNVWEHVLNSVCMLFDMFMVAFPSRVMHFIYPLILGLIYSFFSLIYYWSGGTDFSGNHFIYFILDWKKPAYAIGAICLDIVLLLIFCIVVFWIYRLRTWIHKRCMMTQTMELI